MPDPGATRTNLTTLPIIPLFPPTVLLPGAILRFPLDSRKDMQALIAKLTYDSFERSSSSSGGAPPVPGATSGEIPTVDSDVSGGDNGGDSTINPREGDLRVSSSEPEFLIGFVPLDPSHTFSKDFDPTAQNGAPPPFNSLYPIGVLGRVVGFEQSSRLASLPSVLSPTLTNIPNTNTATLLIEGRTRFRLHNGTAQAPLQTTPYIISSITLLPDPLPNQRPNDHDLPPLFAQLKSLATTLLNLLRNAPRTLPTPTSSSPSPPSAMAPALVNRLLTFIDRKTIDDAGRLADFFTAVIEGNYDEKVRALGRVDINERVAAAVDMLRVRVEEVRNVIITAVQRSGIQGREGSDRERALILSRRRGGALPAGFLRGGAGGPEDDDRDRDLDDLLAKLEKKLPFLRDHAKGLVEREVKRLKRMAPQQPEYAVLRTWLETVADMPWGSTGDGDGAAAGLGENGQPSSAVAKGDVTEDRLDLGSMQRARKILDEDHFGLEKVKRRILEYMAVLRLKVEMVGEKEDRQVDGEAAVIAADERTEDGNPVANSQVQASDAAGAAAQRDQPFPAPSPAAQNVKPVVTRAPILLLVGPPGTGKTSLAKSIATALGRKFHRISLGGIHSEAEIRGHRRTYIAAMPGVIANGLKKVGVLNPVFLLDEIDKVGQQSHNGDPSAALLEVLDPEQNHTFSDHYLSPLTLDLSKVIFLATANDKFQIPPALLDRMETIHLSAYTNLEKLHIATRFLVPKQVRNNGLREDQIVLKEETVGEVIKWYTREPGVRNLEREIASVVRAKAVQYIEARDAARRKGIVGANVPNYRPTVASDELESILGRKKYVEEEVLERGGGEKPGVVNGLVAFSTGKGVMSGSGAIIVIEAAAMPGGSGLKLTGNLGSVIKESVEVALTWVRAHAYDLGLTNSRDEDLTKNKSIHVHCPAGSDPKDGPSAGVAFVVALISLFSHRPVPATIAMTGEVSLRGRVTAVGAIKEKLIGGLTAGIKTVIVPARNHYDVRELPEEVKRGLNIVCAQHMYDVLKVIWPDWTSAMAHSNDDRDARALAAIAPITSRL